MVGGDAVVADPGVADPGVRRSGVLSTEFGTYFWRKASGTEYASKPGTRLVGGRKGDEKPVSETRNGPDNALWGATASAQGFDLGRRGRSSRVADVIERLGKT